MFHVFSTILYLGMSIYSSHVTSTGTRFENAINKFSAKTLSVDLIVLCGFVGGVVDTI